MSINHRLRSRALGLLTLLAGILCSAPAFAQADFSGQWAPLYHEDHPERIPGPELGDYLGIPLNEAGRLRADSYDADRMSVVQEYQCRPHARRLHDARPGEHARRCDSRSGDAARDGDPHCA